MLFAKRKRELPPLISDKDLNLISALNYDTVLEWLVGLSDDDYKKVVATAEIYRKADAEAFGVLGKANKPISFINPPKSTVDVDPAYIAEPKKIVVQKEPKK